MGLSFEFIYYDIVGTIETLNWTNSYDFTLFERERIKLVGALHYNLCNIAAAEYGILYYKEYVHIMGANTLVQTNIFGMKYLPL